MPMERLETINPVALAPWERRIQTHTNEPAPDLAAESYAVRIAVSSFAQNDVVGMGGLIEMRLSEQSEPVLETFSSTLCRTSGQNPYSGV
jgi:hypothetical protein